MEKLSSTPKNPRQFVILCFGLLKTNPQLRDNSEIIVKVLEKKDLGLFYSAYGYFWVHRNRQVLSPSFHPTKLEAKEWYYKLLLDKL